MYLVAQCWDDGVENDRRVADLCRKYEAKATFNLNPGLDSHNGCFKYQDFEVRRLDRKEHQAVYDGFELASHMMTHPWPHTLKPEEFRRECVDCRHYIEDLKQKEQRGFAWPFGDAPDWCVEILREEGFAYGRTVKNADDILADGEPLLLPSHCHFSNEDFEKIHEKAKATGRFYFWGHSYEMKADPERWNRYENILKSLHDDPEAVWVNVVDLVTK